MVFGRRLVFLNPNLKVNTVNSMYDGGANAGILVQWTATNYPQKLVCPPLLGAEPTVRLCLLHNLSCFCSHNTNKGVSLSNLRSSTPLPCLKILIVWKRGVSHLVWVMVVEVWGADTREYEHEEGLPFYVERICERKMQHFRRNALSTPLPPPIESRIKPPLPQGNNSLQSTILSVVVKNFCIFVF